LSHSKERKEKVCLNCNASLYGRFCHQCGQENIEPKQSAWHLVTHFFYDITHFDGKFFTTLKDLVVKPGFLSREYILGRRSSYLNPVRMYVFTSAFFFIVFFSIFNPKKFDLNKSTKGAKDSVIYLDKGMKAALAEVHDKEDSDAIREAFSNVKKLPLKVSFDSSGKIDNTGINTKVYIAKEYDYETVGQYDSAQTKLQPVRRNGWFKTMVVHKIIDLKGKYQEDKSEFLREWFNEFLHSFPKLLFISLPIFALLLKFLYIRRRNFYYADHGIFAIHMYIYSFMALLIFFAFNGLQSISGWSWLGILKALLFIFSFYYFYKAMRNFYMQGGIKTALKYILLSFMLLFVIIGLFVFFILFSVLEI
jgi:Protein of unknown function (DUF3667)